MQVFELVNIFSASLPYYLQLKKFQETKSSEGFSLKVSFMIITSCILRIYFRFGKYYHWSLFAQAVLLSLIHIWLIYEAVKCKNYNIVSDFIENNKNKYNEKEIVNLKSVDKDIKELKSPVDNLLLISKLNKENIFDLKVFFNWNQLQYYLITILLFSLFVGFLCESFGMENIIFVEILGISNTIIEGSMALPQIFEINRTKNVDNLSIGLIASWFIGDFMKTYYFIVSGSPFQFLLLGIYQVTLNFCMVYLFLKYRK